MRVEGRLIILFMFSGFIFASCEGPMGRDANKSCTLCHNSSIVDAYSIEYKYSLHYSGEAFEEGTRAACAPCHSHQGFTFVTSNTTPATFVADAANPGKYLNSYSVDAATASLPGNISCFTCHSSLHTTYTEDDFMPLASTSAVAMTMYGGNKTINFSKSSSNLCTKCHQPRPVTASSGNLIDYTKLTAEPGSAFTMSGITFRTGVHYSTQGAMAAGTGGIEFGSGYTSSAHTSAASCTACHMAAPSGMSGGHSFIAAGNFQGCNITGCHSSPRTPMSTSNSSFAEKTAEISQKIESLGDKIDALYTPSILQKDPSTGDYTGYFDVYDPISNTAGKYKSSSTTGWTDTQKTYNNTLLPMTITNAQFGAVLNLQLVIRDGSSGVHNYPYIKKLLDNTTAAL